MSLSHHLNDRTSPIRTFVDTYFVFQPLSRHVNKELKSIPTTHRPDYIGFYEFTLAGTAADLMVAGLFDRNIHNRAAVRAGLDVLSKSENYFSDAWNTWGNGHPFQDDVLDPPKTTAVIEAFEHFSSQRNFCELDDASMRQYARFCILFAKVDHARRSFSFGPLMRLGPLSVEEKLEEASTQEMVDDLLNLFTAFVQRHSLSKAKPSSVAVGQTLKGSADVDGADFDFVLDGCLFEVKTTVKPAISTAMLRQCVGYWLLDYDDEFSIHDIAIDLPRQGITKRLSVRDCLLKPEFSFIGTWEIRERFRDAVQMRTKMPGTI